MKNTFSAFLMLLLLGGALTFGRTDGMSAQQPVGVQESVAKLQLQEAYAAFAGEWKGQLEYRDYSNDKRVTLPTILNAALSEDNGSLLFSYIYDEGRGRTLKDTEVISIDLARNKFTFASEDRKNKTEYTVEGLREFSGKRQGTLLLMGTGEENSKPVEVRKTITLADGTLTVLKETKLAGGEFRFRNQYTFTRVEKPAND